MTEMPEHGELATEKRAARQPLSPVERRVAGVLIEKAKTTPDSYPLSLNSLRAGCNQKSNRSPQMNLDADDAEDAIESLRQKGAVAVIQGGGRVVKYRHYMKEWLDIDGTELAVVAELMLRGPQTVGELRGRAARMAAIADLGALRPVLTALSRKGLVIALSPEGRGQVVTHGLYPKSELDRIYQKHGGAAAPNSADSLVHSSPALASTESSASPSTGRQTTSNQAVDAAPASATAIRPVGRSDGPGEFAELWREFAQLREEVSRLRQEIDDLWANVGRD